MRCLPFFVQQSGLITKSNGKIYRVVAAQDTAVASGSAFSFKH